MQLRVKSTCRKERGMSETSGWSKVKAVEHIWNIRVASRDITSCVNRSLTTNWYQLLVLTKICKQNDQPQHDAELTSSHRSLFAVRQRFTGTFPLAATSDPTDVPRVSTSPYPRGAPHAANPGAPRLAQCRHHNSSSSSVVAAPQTPPSP